MRIAFSRSAGGISRTCRMRSKGTALTLDVFLSTLFMIGMSAVRPCAQQCQWVLAVWALCSGGHLMLSAMHQIPRALVHAATLALFLAFIYADLKPSPAIMPGAAAGSNNDTAVLLFNSPQPSSSMVFFSRNALYTGLVTVDAYLFRPLFLPENERLFFCKYGPVLLAAWPWCLFLGGFFAVLQGVRAFHHPFAHEEPSLSACSHSTSKPPHANAFLFSSHSSKVDNVQELDVMEAFSLAKQQHMGSKGAN